MKSLAIRAHEKGLELAYHVQPDVPQVVVGDAGRLRQVFVNLTSNAIKFTEDGEVTVSVSTESQADSRVVLHFSVRDTGIGIEEDKLEMIFDAFSQGDGSSTRMYGGTGLGLAIASQLVSDMNGELWVESILGKGSTFHFTAEFEVREGAPVEGTDEARFATELLEAMRGEESRTTETPTRSTNARVSSKSVCARQLGILLAEDNVINQKFTSKLLRKRGHTVTVASNGREAVSACQCQRFDAVLMDVQMPEMSGFEAVRHIRQMEAGTNVHTPVIALTARAMKGDREKCLEAGMDAYVSKPFKPEELIDMLEELVQEFSPV